ncbi:PGF-pre-PGF domain-containing protein [Methanohalophilus levihalophilus]|uniref:S8 family serine peptidase n=1 Tax=Methanohalophilus levihalophilus TaxID=1431282 RepID=UPI001AE0E94B|nr:S8 family serine peptidase [Methanohalophilus levihalophilus]MBP2029561.1 PGF-pre-PGF domain-containing protein [Methanohalophilus levihalophilus]
MSLIPVQALQSDNAEIADDSDLILLKNAHINTENQIPARLAQTAAIESNSNDPILKSDYYLVQFEGHVRSEYKQAIEAEDATLHGYIPNNAYLVRIPESNYETIVNLPFVKWIGPYLPLYKISPNLQSRAGIVEINVVLFDSVNNSNMTMEIEMFGGQVNAQEGKYIRATIDSSKVYDIATIEEVKWIGEYQTPVLLNNNATIIMNVNVDNVRSTHGLSGSGQIIGIADTGIDIGEDNSSMHYDLQGRIDKIFPFFDSDASDPDGHGTHVAGSAIGNGTNSSGVYAGAAPNASLVFQALYTTYNNTSGLFLPLDLSVIFEQAYSSNVTVHSNSWGTNNSSSYGSYDIDSQSVDSFMWNNPDMLILFAAGNDGPTSDTIGLPATAKNCLTIGASENLHSFGGTKSDNASEIASFSSRGPTDDGRIKPDLVAPGTYVVSTNSHVVNSSFDYVIMSGTSMATPLTAGTVALVRQYYVENESIIPTAALLKATLINGAADLGHSSFDQGWGRVDLNNSLFPSSPSGFLYYDNITLNTTEKWQIQQSFSNSTALKISLVWTDYPAEPAASKTLINDLDLILESPNGTLYYANGSEPDTINNVEQIYLESFEAGIFNISVNGTNVPEDPQPFALVLSGTFDIEPPSSIQITGNTTGFSSINWTWTNPVDSDFNYTMIYLNGTFKANVSNPTSFYNATGLNLSTTYQIETRTVDTSGNINATWENDTATTLKDSTEPTIHSVNLNNSTPNSGENILISVNVTDDHIVNAVTANNQSLTSQGNNLWNGTLTALVGNQNINVSAIDFTGNIAWNNSTSYLGYQLPEANFTSNVTSGNKPLTVQFNDTSTNFTTLSWDFDGNGTEDSNASEPVWTFTEAGNHSVNLTATNENGSDTYTGYIVVTTPSTPSRSSSSSGGGGGGGAGNTGEDLENILFKDFAIQYLEKGTPATYEFTEEGNTVRSISLTANKNSGQIKIIIEVLQGTSTIASEKPEGNVYSNLNIWAGNAAFKESIENAVITFEVSKDWLVSNGIPAEDVTMMMYTDDGWIPLDSVSIVSETEEYVTYEAETQKLASPFAITSGTIPEDSVDQFSESMSEESSGEIQSNETPEEGTGNNALSTIGILPCALLLAGAYAILRRKQ